MPILVFFEVAPLIPRTVLSGRCELAELIVY